MIKPPAKLERLPESAIPTATPADAKSAAKPVVSTPNLLIMAKASTMFNRIFTRPFKKVCTLVSIFRFSRTLAINTPICLIIKRPTEYIRMATSISLPASIPKSTSFSSTCPSLLPEAAFNNNKFIFSFNK